MGHWSDLPGDLLNAIEGHLTLHVDKVRVRAICLAWKSHLPKMMRNGLPSLLGAFENDNKSFSLFNIIEQKFDHLHIPDLQGKVFRGSSYGWVVVHEDIPEGWAPDFSASENSHEDIPDEDIPDADSSSLFFQASQNSDKGIPGPVFQASHNSDEDNPYAEVTHPVFPAIVQTSISLIRLQGSKFDFHQDTHFLM
ncbi:hypothetical protein LguiB_033078 [Lonicera macranthoides]